MRIEPSLGPSVGHTHFHVLHCHSQEAQQTKQRVQFSNVIDDIVTGKKELHVVAAIAPQANQYYMRMHSGLKVAFACMSQDGEGVLSIKFNVIVNGVVSRSLVLVY